MGSYGVFINKNNFEMFKRIYINELKRIKQEIGFT